MDSFIWHTFNKEQTNPKPHSRNIFFFTIFFSAKKEPKAILLNIIS